MYSTHQNLTAVHTILYRNDNPCCFLEIMKNSQRFVYSSNTGGGGGGDGGGDDGSGDGVDLGPDGADGGSGGQ